MKMRLNEKAQIGEELNDKRATMASNQEVRKSSQQIVYNCESKVQCFSL